MEIRSKAPSPASFGICQVDCKYKGQDSHNRSGKEAGEEETGADVYIGCYGL